MPDGFLVRADVCVTQELKSNEHVVGTSVIDVVVGARNKDDIDPLGGLLGGVLDGL